VATDAILLKKRLDLFRKVDGVSRVGELALSDEANSESGQQCIEKSHS
jgi:hypothetical protein